MGFIDQYSNEYECRFVLVLNDDQLSSKNDQDKIWSAFREKVIDQEIRLTTSPEEALSIALQIESAKYYSILKKSVITCGVSNIRILVKVIRVLNILIGDRDIEEPIQARIVPSIVLFSAIHYRGLRDGPIFNFVLNIGSGSNHSYSETKDEKVVRERREASWRMLLNELGIRSCDEFERCLVGFLESGLFDKVTIDTRIDYYVKEKEKMTAKAAAREFIVRCIWDHRTSESQLVLEAEQFRKSAGLLDPYTVTQLYEELVNIVGGAELSNAIVDCWIMNANGNRLSKIDDHDPFDRKLHDKIRAHLDEADEDVEKNTTVIDVCMKIANTRSWGAIEQLVLQQATAEGYEEAIRGIEDMDVLGRFMRQMIDMRLNPQVYDRSFGQAAERFVEACRNIVNDDASPRLAKLINFLFNHSKISSDLAPPAVPKYTSSSELESNEIN